MSPHPVSLPTLHHSHFHPFLFKHPPHLSAASALQPPTLGHLPVYICSLINLFSPSSYTAPLESFHSLCKLFHSLIQFYSLSHHARVGKNLCFMKCLRYSFIFFPLQDTIEFVKKKSAVYVK